MHLLAVSSKWMNTIWVQVQWVLVNSRTCLHFFIKQHVMWMTLGLHTYYFAFLSSNHFRKVNYSWKTWLNRAWWIRGILAVSESSWIYLDQPWELCFLCLLYITGYQAVLFQPMPGIETPTTFYIDEYTYSLYIWWNSLLLLTLAD